MQKNDTLFPNPEFHNDEKEFIQYISSRSLDDNKTAESIPAFRNAVISDLCITIDGSQKPITAISHEDILDMSYDLHTVSIQNEGNSHNLDLPLTLISYIKKTSEQKPDENAWIFIQEHYKDAEKKDVESTIAVAEHNNKISQSLESMLQKLPGVSEAIIDSASSMETLIQKVTEKAYESHSPSKDVKKELEYDIRCQITNAIRAREWGSIADQGLELSKILKESLVKAKMIVQIDSPEIQKIALSKPIEQLQSLQSVDRMMQAMKSASNIIAWKSPEDEKQFVKAVIRGIKINSDPIDNNLESKIKNIIREEAGARGATYRKSYSTDAYIGLLSMLGIKKTSRAKVEKRMIALDLMHNPAYANKNVESSFTRQERTLSNASTLSGTSSNKPEGIPLKKSSFFSRAFGSKLFPALKNDKNKPI